MTLRRIYGVAKWVIGLGTIIYPFEGGVPEQYKTTIQVGKTLLGFYFMLNGLNYFNASIEEDEKLKKYNRENR